MKRSEAVQRIKEIHNRIFNVQMYDAFEEDELCDMFLDRIEVELGMTPPQTDDSCQCYSKEWDKE